MFLLFLESGSFSYHHREIYSCWCGNSCLSDSLVEISSYLFEVGSILYIQCSIEILLAIFQASYDALVKEKSFLQSDVAHLKQELARLETVAKRADNLQVCELNDFSIIKLYFCGL